MDDPLCLFLRCICFRYRLRKVGAQLRIDSKDNYPSSSNSTQSRDPIAIVTPRIHNHKKTHTGKCKTKARTISTTSDRTKNSRIASLHKSRMKLEKDIIVTTGIIIFFVTLLTTPFQFVLFLEGFEIVHPSRDVRVYIGCLSFLNSALNPWLYAWRISHTRRELKNLCLGCIIW